MKITLSHIINKFLYTFFILFIYSQHANAQQLIDVKGVVTDTLGQTLPGVTIKSKLVNQYAVSKADGSFNIKTSSTSETLLLTYVGYQTMEIALNGRTSLTAIMREDARSLNEVVVIGYGTQKKVNLTGAVSVIGSKELTMRPVGQTTAALQGLAPGVTVTQSSGRPGGDGGTIRIRGIGTLNDANPLTLIDNVEGSLANIDPSIIESISVLKDAASSSIYGSRAANGVILVTTKRANGSQLNVSYNSYVGWQRATNLPQIVDAVDHMTLINLAYTNTGRTPLYSNTIIENTRNGTDPDLYPNTDWQKEVLTGSGFMQNHFVAISGGGEKVHFLTSLAYFDQGGLLETSHFKRYTIRNNADVKFSDKLSLKLDLQLTNQITKEPGRGTNSVFNQMNRIASNVAGIFANGNYGEGSNGNNPIAYSRPEGGLAKTTSPGMIFNSTLSYKPVKWLQADLTVAPRYDQSDDNTFITALKTYKANGDIAFTSPAQASLELVSSRSFYNNIRATLTATQSYKKNNFKMLAGASREDYRNDTFSASRTNFLFPDYPVLNTGSSATQLNTGVASEWALQSVFGRLNYDYDERYLLEFNGRYDGSSRFTEGNRYGFFPSISAGWRISQEKFFEPLTKVIPELKVRASWGRLGNQNIGTYPAITLVELGAYSLGNQIYTIGALNNMANRDITWESTEMKDIGLDAILFNSLDVTIGYYQKRTNDILYDLDVPLIIGQQKPFQNAGVVRNNGWEMALNYRGNINQFKYSIGFNISDVRNQVIDLKGVNRTGITVSNEGHSINSLYGYEALGIFQSDAEVASHATQFGSVKAGDIIYKDQNGDGVITDLDNVIIGTTIPRYTYSSTINASYRGFDVGIFLQGVGKANGYLYEQSVMPFFNGGTVQEMHKDNWTPQNTSAKFPRLAFGESNNEKASSFWVKDASYLRLKNLQIGYRLPAKILKSVGIKNLRIYANGSNLFTWDKFWDGYDVEAPVGTGNIYPQVKVYSFGVDVNF